MRVEGQALGRRGVEIPTGNFREKEPMVTLYPVRNVYAYVNSAVFLRERDVICNADLNRLVRFSLHEGKPISMVIMNATFLGIVSLHKRSVVKFVENSLLKHGVDANTHFRIEELIEKFMRSPSSRDVERSIPGSLVFR